ncbi:MAG: DUF523 domain-containing protein [Clostridiales bacterium]|nr:DUF523 domain-containing protein [Clostridiales bacterium]
MPVLISACLLGIKCRYDGGDCYNQKAVDIAVKEGGIPVCPEQLGGFATPRPPAEIDNGSGGPVLEGSCCVKGKDGEDKTEKFILGAEETLKIARLCGAGKAILKARSPSCGKGVIYDGTFSGIKKAGNGVTAEILLRNGLEVITEDELL